MPGPGLNPYGKGRYKIELEIESDKAVHLFRTRSRLRLLVCHLYSDPKWQECRILRVESVRRVEKKEGIDGGR